MLCVMCNGNIDQADKLCPFCDTPIAQNQEPIQEEFIDDYEELINIDALIEEAQKQSEEVNSYDEILASLEKITGYSELPAKEDGISPKLDDIPMVVMPPDFEVDKVETVSIEEPLIEQVRGIDASLPTEEENLEDIPISAVESEVEVKPVSATIEEKKVQKPIKTIIMLVLLALSMSLNIILLSNVASNNLDTDKSKISENKIKVLSNKYYLWVPDNWISTTSPDGISTIFDESEAWATSFHFVEGISYQTVKENIKTITDSFGQNKYLFTSDYTKTVDDTDFIVFKGKFHEYIIYVIVASFDDNTIALADLKFKSEVNEDIINSVMTALTTASIKDVSDVWKDDFKFENMSEIITTAILDEKI